MGDLIDVPQFTSFEELAECEEVQKLNSLSESQWRTFFMRTEIGSTMAITINSINMLGHNTFEKRAIYWDQFCLESDLPNEVKAWVGKVCALNDETWTQASNVLNFLEMTRKAIYGYKM